MELSLKGKTALICGSSQGIGLATAKELAILGAECILLARNKESLQNAVESLAVEHLQEHSYVVADFRDTRQIEDAVKGIISRKAVHILVNNTGGPKGGPLIDADTHEFTDTFQQHLICNHILVQAVIAGMTAAGYGRIINIISTSVKTPLKNLGVSNTVRWAVASWAKTLAGELAPYGITVNNVLPGSTNTTRLKSLMAAIATKRNAPINTIEEEMLSEIPMKRFGDAKEIAAAVTFLATPAAGYITGINISVDGGKTPVL
ncbi:3-oxoacyl-[acyl-carrier protein] reductase [Chitinophaga sp. CF118]|uniref:SDR family oxidoreductase n=1 Tax=Chitinophaga sp. CF118 TaxID=1884367 RepID=UPI0008E2F929|nr:SDR family oxidoreductase [Chitinophaga sp. CF118]SFE77484.1 3-oxoacyl-[acyl-carrier protein] reductase [Chitinophaga sp. CF118]